MYGISLDDILLGPFCQLAVKVFHLIDREVLDKDEENIEEWL